MFNDLSLNDLINQNKDVIKDHLKSLDELSHDIRKLSDVLLNSAVPGPIALPIISENASYIIWDGKSIMWSSETMVRRLIETPKEIRIKCKPYLQTFLKLCLEKLGEK